MLPENSFWYHHLYPKDCFARYVQHVHAVVPYLEELTQQTGYDSFDLRTVQKYLSLDLLDVFHAQGLITESPLRAYDDRFLPLGQSTYAWMELSTYLHDKKGFGHARVMEIGARLAAGQVKKTITVRDLSLLCQVLVPPDTLALDWCVHSWSVAVLRLYAVMGPRYGAEAYLSPVGYDGFIQMLREIQGAVLEPGRLSTVMLQRIASFVPVHISNLHHCDGDYGFKLSFARVSLLLSLCYLCVMRAKLWRSFVFHPQGFGQDLVDELGRLLTHMCQGVLHVKSGLQQGCRPRH